MPETERRKNAGASVAGQTPKLSLYADIMFELRRRVEWVGHVVAGQTNLDPHLGQEFCLLQLRFACELLALGCLVAHGDIAETQSKRFSDEWSATNLLNGLERLNAAFFPIPVQQTPTAHEVRGKVVDGWHFQEVSEPYLKKSDVVRLYGRLGEALHRGSANRLSTSRARYQGRSDAIVNDTNSLIRLLSLHRMQLVTGDQFVCMLKNENDEVSTFLASPVGPDIGQTI